MIGAVAVAHIGGRAVIDVMDALDRVAVLAEFFPHFEAHDKFEILQAFAAIPTTILCGTKDLLTSIGHSRKMAKQIPTARLVEVAGAGRLHTSSPLRETSRTR